MVQATVSTPVEPEADYNPSAQFLLSGLQLFQTIRYRKNLVFAVMAAVFLLAGLYYATAPRRYSSKAALLITQTNNDLDTSITNKESQSQNTMATFENLVCSARVVEGALKSLPPADQIDFQDVPPENRAAALKANLSAKAVRLTSILEISYRSKDPQVAMNVVRAVVQSYIEFMDSMHKGTAGELNRMLTKERDEIEEKLNVKQKELQETRRRFADMGLPADGATLHPTVQKAVSFSDALIASQKQRVEYEALLAAIQTAIANGQDFGQYLLSAGDSIGRELLLSSLGLGSRDAYTMANLERDLLAAHAQLQNLQQNLGPNHPEVVALAAKVGILEQFMAASDNRIQQHAERLRTSELGPWLAQMVQQKLNEAKQREAIQTTCFEAARTEAINLNGQLVELELLNRDIKRLKEMSSVLFTQISSLDLRQNGQDVRVAETEPPKLLKNPISPKLSTVALLSMFGGLGASLGLVMLLDVMDDRFRSVEEIQTRLGLPILTMIQRLETPESTGPRALVTNVSPTSVASESFRTLRTALTLTHPDARHLVVTSAEPGDGKTTTLANLAVCYAQADKRTLLIDADLRRPGLTGLMDMRGTRGLSEVLRSEVEISQLAPQHIQLSGVKGLDVLPSGPRPSDPAELLSGPRFSQLLAWAETAYDMILVDSPPTLATADTAIIGRLVDGVVIVMQPAKNRRRLVTRVVERLGLMKIPLLGIIVNQASGDGDQGYYDYHAYGYGYGADYSYGNEESDNASPATGDGNDEDDGDGDGEEGCLPFDGGTDRQLEDEEESESLLIPRRVA